MGKIFFCDILFIRDYSWSGNMVDWSWDKIGVMDKCMLVMLEDLVLWMGYILSLEIMVDMLMEDFDIGVVLCRLVNVI